MKRKLPPLFLVLLISFSGYAQDQSKGTSPFDTAFFDMSLEQLMNVEISVTSRNALTPRESPGIVTLITEDEIKNSGAQDIMDVLKLVPGFDFGCDVEGVTGIGIRGNWAHEGKMVLLLDGMEMNEQMYATLQFGNHYPIDQVKRIEIIRGPGSAVYGGNAEYAVINIITINNKEFTGITATASYGQMEHTFSQRKISLSAGRHFGDLALNIGALVGEGNRSESDYTDYLGNTTNLEDKQALNPAFVELAASYKNFSLRAIADHYHTTTIDGFDELLQQPYNLDFTSYYFEAKYKWKVNDKLSITPRFNFKQQAPWNFVGSSVDDEFAPYDRSAYQPMYNITANYDANEHLNIQTGGEYYTDKATENTSGETFNNGQKSVCYHNTALFAQGLWSNKIANITLGARYHNSSSYDPSFVPRIGITKVINKFHSKFLFSKAYRAPGIENIDRSIDIKPENTTVAEFETGYQLSEHAFLSVNVYDITTEDALIYYYDNGDAYKNGGTTGTRGVEMEMKLKGRGGYAEMNYSFYTTQGKAIVSNYSVEKDPHVLLAFPAHKVNISGSLKITKSFSLNGSLSWKSSRYSFVNSVTPAGINVTQEHAPQLFSNVYLSFTNVLVKGFSVGLGCHDLTNEKEIYIQPYNSSHSPLPGASREVYLKITYQAR